MPGVIRVLLLCLLVIAQTTLAAPPTVVSITPNVGPSSGGTAVTITITPGQFPCFVDPCGGDDVAIGGIVVPHTMVNSTTLLAVTPPHPPGVVDVEIKPGMGKAGPPAVLPNGFNYLAEAIPSLSHLAMLALAFVLAVSGLMRLRSVY